MNLRTLNRLRTAIRAPHVRYVEHAGRWHRVQPGVAGHAVYVLACDGRRVYPARVAMDLVTQDITCKQCREGAAADPKAESEEP